jgi:hypothetical protein
MFALEFLLAFRRRRERPHRRALARKFELKLARQLEKRSTGEGRSRKGRGKNLQLFESDSRTGHGSSDDDDAEGGEDGHIDR